MTTARPTVLFLNSRTTDLEVAPAWAAAESLGLDVVLICDTPPSGLRAGHAAEIHLIDTYRPADVLECARAIAADKNVVGVTTWSDRDVETVALVAQDLGLPGVPVEAAHRARNKGAMRRALAHRPELIPKFRVISTYAELQAAVTEIGVPAVLKPTTGSGSKGIFIVGDAAEADAAWQFLHHYTTSGPERVFEQAPGELIYEQMMLGSEHSVEGLVVDGVVLVAGITDKTTTPVHRIEIAHEFPTSLAPDRADAVVQLARSVVTELGLDNCAFHLECFVDDDGRARLVEVAARVGGDYITSHLVPLATGRNFYADVLRVVTGHNPDPYVGSPNGVAGVRKILAEAEGTFSSVEGWAEVSAWPSVSAACLERQPGEVVRLPPDDVVTCVVATVIGHRPVAQRDQLRDDLNAVSRRMTVQMQAGVA